MPYELPDHNHPRTIVFRVQYVPDGDDLVTVWLEPNLSHGATAENQPRTSPRSSRPTLPLTRSTSGSEGGGNGWIVQRHGRWRLHSMTLWWCGSGRPGGSLAWWRCLCFPPWAAPCGVVEKRKYQIQLKQAEQQHVLAQERARIAQDLHDDLGSSLTRISLLSTLLQADKDKPDQVAFHAGKLSESADQTVRARWRKSSGRCGPAAIRCRAWSNTLRTLRMSCSRTIRRVAGLTCRTICRPNPLPADVRHNIFLIVKEALTNALRHAGAKEVRVQAKVSANALEILVQDDGRGFEPSMPPMEGRRHGLGTCTAAPRPSAEPWNCKAHRERAPPSGWRSIWLMEPVPETLESKRYCRTFMRL